MYDAATQAALSGGYGLGGYGGGYGAMDTTGLTPEQLELAQQKRRQLMYAQQLMGASGGGTPKSFLGGFAQNATPGLGYLLRNNALTNAPPAVPPPAAGSPLTIGSYY